MGFIRWLFGKDEHISDLAIEHSSKGVFTVNPKTNKINTLKSGGHGQENIDYLNKMQIKYNVVREYKNGVRIGNVPKHKSVRKRTGTNQSWFPKEWGRNEILNAGKYVARCKKKKKDGIEVRATYKKVKVGIRRTKGKIATIYPTNKQKGGFKNDCKRYSRKSK